jgi:hypothetical protein
LGEFEEPEHCRRILNDLGCDAYGEIQQHDLLYGQKWKTGNGSPFFIQHDEACGKVLAKPFERIHTHLIRIGRNGSY